MFQESDSYLTVNKYLQLLNSKEKGPFSESSMAIIHHIVLSIQNAEKGISNIDPETQEGKEILEYEGYTGTRTRHFYNNICSSDRLSNVKYLEIGTWYGSSSISAVYNNSIDGLFIDNWSQFGGDPNVFTENISKFGSSSNCYLLEGDCWKIDLKNLEIAPFNIYLFDGDHSELDHFKALEYYLPVLDNEFIFMVDDWNWPNVRDGTMRAIRELDLFVKFRHEIFVSNDDLKDMPNHKGKETWWNGIGIFLLSKTT
jgi:hypothetical protein